jgi:NAD(P)-dependent dehydrogenase (short-subunit alcohol dehydrogenase family)
MPRTAVVAGVGPGLGASVARRFAAEGLQVGLLARTEPPLEELAADLSAGPGEGLAVPADLSDPGDVAAAFETVRDAYGPVDALVYNASGASWSGLLDASLESFERALDVGVTGAFCCAREAVGDMVERGEGTVIFTGATSAVRGRDGAVGFSAAKFGARGLAESMAREFGPRGVHVAHVVVDGSIRHPDDHIEHPERHLDPDAIADSYWTLLEQDRSAWTLELDLRPHVERF